MKIIKRLALIVLIILGVLIAAGAIIGFVYKDQLFEKVKNMVSTQIEGDFDASDVSLSIFRSFPSGTLTLENPIWVNTDTVFYADNLRLSVALNFIWNKKTPVKLNEFFLDKPIFNLVADTSGVLNAALTQTDRSDSNSPEGELAFEFKAIRIVDGKIAYTDLGNGQVVTLDNVNHNGRGDFSQNIFDYESSTTVDSITVRDGQVSYLNNVKGQLDLNLEINQDSALYRLKDNQLKLNELLIQSVGYVRMTEPGVYIDLTLNTPDNDIVQLVSLIPGVYARDLKDVRTAGSLALNAKIDGQYVGDQWPALDATLNVKNGRIEHPELPHPIEDIQMLVTAKKENGVLDLLEVHAEPFNLKIASNPVRGYVHLSQLLSDPYVDGQANGKIDLNSIRSLLKTSALDISSGIIDFDMSAKTRLSAATRQAYDEMNLSGKMTVTSMALSYDRKGYFVENADITMSPDKMTVKSFSVTEGEAAARGQLTVQNPLAIMDDKSPVRIAGNLSAENINLNDYMSASSTTNDSTNPASAAGDYSYINRYHAELRVVLNDIVYDVYDIAGFEGDVAFHNSKLNIEDGSGIINGQRIYAEGSLNDIDEYLSQRKALSGTMNVRSGNLDANALLGLENSTGASATGGTTSGNVARIPKNLNIRINAQVANLKYQTYQVKNVSGWLELEDGVAAFHEVSGGSMGGRIQLNGNYAVEDGTPMINVKALLRDIGIQEAYEQSGMLKSFAPVAKRIEGALNSDIAFSSALTPAYYPSLNTVSLDGYIETVNGILKRAPVMEKLNGFINNEKFKTIKLEDTRNWVSIKQGQVNVQPFDIEVEGFKLTISGWHNLQNQMDYDFVLDVPKAYVNQLKVGEYLDQGISQLEQTLANQGLAINLVESYRFNIDMTGNMGDPDMKVSFAGAGKKNIKDAIGTQIKEQKKAVRDTVGGYIRDAAGNIIDSLKLEGKDKVETILKDILKGGKKDTSATATDPKKDIKKDAEKEVDKIKEKLKEFNPFKKTKNEKKGDS